MAKIYQGESLTMVFRCKHKCGRPVNMSGVDISVILRDMNGEVVYSFSTLGTAGAKSIRVDGSYVVCSLTNKEMAEVVGSYVIEVKVRMKEVVMIDVSKKIKVYPSVIGENVAL